MSTSTNSRVTASSAPRTGTAHDRATSICAFVVRITLGLLWLANLSWKKPPDFGAKDGSGLYHFTKLAIDYPVFPPYSALVKSVVLPNFTVFGWAVFLLEIGLAVFLLLGLATRLWALIGIAQTVAIFLSVGASPNEWKWSYFLMAAAHLAVLGFAAGRVWGLDALARRRMSGRSGRLANSYLLAS